ncbi:MAG TPA: SRPBCC family protein [Myxococcales bacterium]
MAFEIVKKFVVKADPQAVWQFLIDPERVASCLPGAAITGKLDDKTWTGTMSVKVGPVSSSYKGKIVFEKLDEASMTADLAAIGQDVKGRGGADMKMKSIVRKNDAGETEVTASSQVNITGILAQMGRGMIQDVSDQMFQIFSQRLRAQLEGAPAAAALSAALATPAASASPNSLTAGSGLPAIPPTTARASDTSPSPTSPSTSTSTGTSTGTSTSTGTRTSTSTAAAPPLAPKPEVLDVGSIGARAARNAATRAVRNPTIWIVAAALAGAVYFFIR